MKRIAIGLLAAVALMQAGAAEPEWLTDLPQAQAKAKGENKMVLLDFTGSDWCPPCKALHKNVLTSPEFAEYANRNLVLVEVAFPRNKTHSDALRQANKALAKKFGIKGYPTVVVLDGSGKVLSSKTGYGGEAPASFIAKLKALKS